MGTSRPEGDRDRRLGQVIVATRLACRSSGAHRDVPILYGMPVDVMLRAAEFGLIVTWDCIEDGSFPRWSCGSCGHRWDRLDDADPAASNGAVGNAMRRVAAAT